MQYLEITNKVAPRCYQHRALDFAVLHEQGPPGCVPPVRVRMILQHLQGLFSSFSYLFRYFIPSLLYVPSG